MSSIGHWFRDRPRALEKIYRFTLRIFLTARPLIVRMGLDRADRWLRWLEEPPKKLLFDCRMCGQCILHSTGMTCPMSCPKNLRNGPCGGVRNNGHCEVIPEMKCVWVEAYERSQMMGAHGDEIFLLQPPVNRRLEGSSAWINLLREEKTLIPNGWIRLSAIDVGGAVGENDLDGISLATGG